MLERLLFAKGSPLNRLTRRRNLLSLPRRSVGKSGYEGLVNGSSTGLVQLEKKQRSVEKTRISCRAEPVILHPRRSARN